MQKQADFTESVNEFDAGLLASKLSQVLGHVALGVIEHSKKGTVTLSLSLEQISESSQVNVKHKISYII